MTDSTSREIRTCVAKIFSPFKERYCRSLSFNQKTNVVQTRATSITAYQANEFVLMLSSSTTSRRAHLPTEKFWPASMKKKPGTRSRIPMRKVRCGDWRFECFSGVGNSGIDDTARVLFSRECVINCQSTIIEIWTINARYRIIIVSGVQDFAFSTENNLLLSIMTFQQTLRLRTC